MLSAMLLSHQVLYEISGTFLFIFIPLISRRTSGKYRVILNPAVEPA